VQKRCGEDRDTGEISSRNRVGKRDTGFCSRVWTQRRGMVTGPHDSGTNGHAVTAPETIGWKHVAGKQIRGSYDPVKVAVLLTSILGINTHF